MKPRSALVLLTVLWLSACGFHLRGSQPLPAALQQLRIDAEQPYQELDNSLRRELMARGVELGVVGGAVLKLGRVAHRRRVLSVDAEGDPREYELSAQVRFSVPETGSGFVLPPRQLQVQRDYVFEATGKLSSVAQETVLREEMERELARSIVRALERQSSR